MSDAKTSETPAVTGGLPPGVEQRIAAWLDLMATAEALLLAGLRREIGPDGDLKEAYRPWYAAYRAEHERGVQNLVRRLNEAEARCAP